MIHRSMQCSYNPVNPKQGMTGMAAAAAVQALLASMTGREGRDDSLPRRRTSETSLKLPLPPKFCSAALASTNRNRTTHDPPLKSRCGAIGPPPQQGLTRLDPHTALNARHQLQPGWCEHDDGGAVFEPAHFFALGHAG